MRVKMNYSRNEEIKRRRTFAIISHPDAGKTTITEKLLLYGGAIHQAGSVKARKAARHATSDWMEIEKKRGISVTILPDTRTSPRIHTVRSAQLTPRSWSLTAQKVSRPRPSSFSRSAAEEASRSSLS